MNQMCIAKCLAVLLVLVATYILYKFVYKRQHFVSEYADYPNGVAYNHVPNSISFPGVDPIVPLK